MPRSRALILVIAVLQLGNSPPGVAQTLPRNDFFKHYRETTTRAPISEKSTPAYWAELYQQNIDRYESLQKDIKQFFADYLDGLPVITITDLKVITANDYFLRDKLSIATTAALVEGSLDALEQSGATKLVAEIRNARKGGQLFPLHFRLHEDESPEWLSAYYERGTHKIKMALNRIDPKNWLTWFVHEHLHFLDSKLNEATFRLSDPAPIEQIARWVRLGKTALAPGERKVLHRYFSDLTDLSIKAEWRDWVATSLFAQKALQSGAMKEVPPCLSFLVEFGFGQRNLSTEELKVIWWNKLKLGFGVEPTGLFAHSWIAEELKSYVNSLQIEDLRIERLLELLN